MSLIPPSDKTPIRINGEIVSPVINNPIKFTPPSNSYMRTSIPKKIKINPEVINKEAIIPKDIKTFSSKKGITKNKKDIIKRLLDNKKEVDILSPAMSNNKGPNNENHKSTDEGTTDEGTTNELNYQGPKVEEIKEPGVEKFPDIAVMLNDGGAPTQLKKKTVRRIKRIVKRKVKKETIKSNIPDYDNMNEEEQLMHRNDFTIKFDLLRKWHPGLNIPKDIERHPNLRIVHTVYELYLGAIYNEINSNFYRGMLLITWLGLDLFGVYVLGVDTSIYMKTQINLMWAYEPIINEMSKVNFHSIVQGWSPFQKLMGLVFGSYIFLIIIKIGLSYLGKKMGQNLDGFTPTVIDFVSSMIFSKPKENSLPPIIIGNTNGATNGIMSTDLGGIHNIPVPQASTLNQSMQVGLAQGILGTVNALTGRGDANRPAQGNVQGNNQNRNAVPGNTRGAEAPRRRFVPPSF